MKHRELLLHPHISQSEPGRVTGLVALGGGALVVFGILMAMTWTPAKAEAPVGPGQVYAVTPDGRGPNLGDFVGVPDRDPKTGWVRWTDKAGAVHMSPAVLEFIASGAVTQGASR